MLRDFSLPPSEVTEGIAHPKARGWREAILGAIKSEPSPIENWEDACSALGGRDNYKSVVLAAAMLARGGWTVDISSAYAFSAEKKKVRFFANTKAMYEDGQTKHCWCLSLAYWEGTV